MITINNVYLPLKNPVYSKDDINIYPGEITCISGVSGSGKTTLLYLLALISDYGQCNYAFEDIYLNLKDEKQKADIRKCWIGNVFQENNLLNHLTINENFKIAAKMSGLELSDKDIRQLLDDLQLFDKTGNEYPHELSGGQKQRVAIGVALVKKPKLLIMDEPTSALDSENTKKLMKLISDLCKSRDLMVVLASHDRYVKESADRIYEIKNALIQCVKGDSKIAKGNFPSKFRKSTFSKIAYIRQYYHKFKRTKFILSVLCSIPITFFVLSTVLSNQIVQKQDELISNMTNNEIIVTNHWMQPYYNQDADVLDLELIEKVKQLDEVEYVMPFYVTETFIDGQSVVIQPYNELMNIEQFKDTNNHYVSYVLGEYLNIQSYPIEIETEYGLVQIDGVLESVQENKYYANSYVIYMPFEDFINICPITETSMILVYAKTYSLVYELHDVLRGIFPMAKLECDYINLTSIYESTQVTTMYLKLVSIALYSIVLLMLIIIYSRYIINREYEFCILRTNGLEAREISQIVFIDLVFQSILFFIFSNFFTFLICLLLKGLNIIDYIQYFPLVVSLFIMSVIILIIPAIISIKRINQFSPAQFLRK